jgi:glycosyltransferase involved in cell wall biosynthesis
MPPVRPVVICFAGDAWDGNPHSRHHLARRLCRDFDFLFVEGVPMRAPAADAHELRRIVRKLGSARRSLRTVGPGLHVLKPLPIPPAGRLGRAAQMRELRRSIERACRRVNLDGPRISWFSLPNAAPLRGRLGEGGSLLYYQDRYDAFSHVDSARLRENLVSLARGCDVSIATARHLADDLTQLGADPVLIPHGVDLERFAQPAPAPPDLAGLERPLIGCVGLIDDYVSIAALRAVANSLERGTVVLVGAANVDLAPLRHPRIALLGHRPYDKIPGYVQAFDACLVPFEVNRLTAGVNPIKLREYLAAGRPVVSSDLPEVRPYADVVELVAGPEGFPEAVKRAVSTAGGETHRQERVAGESWDRVAERVARLLRPLVTVRTDAAAPPERLHR